MAQPFCVRYPSAATRLTPHSFKRALSAIIFRLTLNAQQSLTRLFVILC